MSALHHPQVRLVRSSIAQSEVSYSRRLRWHRCADDPTDRLFERFADPIWRDIEDAWQAGRISSRECMRRQVALLRATPEELDEEIRNVRVHPDSVDSCTSVRARAWSWSSSRTASIALCAPSWSANGFRFHFSQIGWSGAGAIGGGSRSPMPVATVGSEEPIASAPTGRGLASGGVWSSATGDRTFACLPTPTSSSPRER